MWMYIRTYLLSVYLVLSAVEDGGRSIYYELYGIVNHYGTIFSGHYTAEIKHFVTGKWFSISDSRCVGWVITQYSTVSLVRKD